MAFVTKHTEEKKMEDEELPGEEPSKGEKPSGEKPEPISYARKEPSTSGPGYFALYKKGQGYWTRMGTLGGVVLIGAFTAYSLYAHVPTFLPTTHEKSVKIAGIVVAVFIVAYCYICWRLLNKPTNVDFLIATDSEMKKVNWTSRKELVGSTKIVIIFMFLVALFLFAVDQIFGWLMYWADVLKVSPFGT